VNPIFEAALQYQNSGLSVVPLKPHDKKCNVAWEEFQHRRATAEEIRTWWSQWPDANVGIVTGKISDIVVIDLDSANAKDKLKDLIPSLDINSIPRSRTGKGWQLFFQHPKVPIGNRAGVIPDLDVRGDGGYVVAPPSIHPNGKTYVWELPINDALPKLPGDLYKLIASPTPNSGEHERFDTAGALAGVPDGKRDDTIFKFACKLRSADIPRDIAEDLILKAANSCDPPFPSREALEKVARVYQKYEVKEAKTNGATIEGIVVQTMETVEEENVDFLWAKRIARSKITDFSGDPGIGKSTAASMIAATISRGQALPFDTEPEAPLRTLIISAEDTPTDILKPRLRKMNADMSLVFIPDMKRNFTPSQIDQKLLEKMFEDSNPALCIIDPIIAYTQGRNTNKASEVREFLGPLASLAEKYKTAIIMIRHLNKNSANSALYRGQGSIDFAAVCRSAFVFAKDNDNPDRRFMSHAKSSLSMLQPTLEFFINEDGIFQWGIETTESADEILTPGKKPEKINEAVKFLQNILANGPMPSNEIKDKAAKADVSWRTIWRAKDFLQIKASKERETGAWFWRLP
jgi:Bifunctional DNA primase/polymerase, N-terminal/AAA domain/Primase C terminal 1 (PriCT-1)